MKKNTLKYAFIVSAFLSPVISFAALEGVKGLVVDIGQIVNLLEPVVYGLALIYFVWGIGQFILNSGEQKARDEGKQKMIWGVVAMFVIFSIMGILRFISGTVGVSLDTSGVIPGSELPRETLPSR